MADEENTGAGRGESTQIMMRITPDLKQRIKDQIDAGKFTTYADFCRSAVYEKLNREEYLERFHACLLEDLDNPDTRKKFRKILGELLAGGSLD